MLSHAYDDLVRANKVQTGPLVILHRLGAEKRGSKNHGLLAFHFPKCKNAASTSAAAERLVYTIVTLF